MLTRKTLVITLIIALAYSQTFEEFEVRFNRRYATEAERQERKQIFLQNKAKID
jgi:hypothetical protein